MKNGKPLFFNPNNYIFVMNGELCKGPRVVLVNHLLKDRPYLPTFKMDIFNIWRLY